MKNICIITLFILSSNLCLAQFNGANGDGFDAIISTHFLQGDGFSIYRGGAGDGHSNIQVSSNLNGSSNFFFSGGHGDGFENNIHSGNLNGEVLFVFHGGDSDGFDSQMRGAFLNSNGDCAEGILLQIDDYPIISGVYEARNELKSKGKVTSGSSVTFNASNSILLEPGFIAENNTLFYAILKECLTAPINY
ncbi:3-coathanger stack domain-containing protein [Arcticibacterium luteifluviistationis]|uniref:Uncharacterized protein n=1 Tax=Arcticibacterium luteifluviistationis TaxID=1784714 RepID=A0A2Z4GAD1_9BACT|nr:3-coathanger stack domain-containing protein [Arcticibacterium luteifluviistationis]AWV98166.1 hypothetical protein DJ013_08260 [Arcticibacterium luteifluviistationis]